MRSMKVKCEFSMQHKKCLFQMTSGCSCLLFMASSMALMRAAQALLLHPPGTWSGQPFLPAGDWSAPNLTPVQLSGLSFLPKLPPTPAPPGGQTLKLSASSVWKLKRTEENFQDGTAPATSAGSLLDDSVGQAGPPEESTAPYRYQDSAAVRKESAVVPEDSAFQHEESAVAPGESAVPDTQSRNASVWGLISGNANKNASDPVGSARKSGKFLNLITWVRFTNDECAATTGDNGTCFTTTECTDFGGKAAGPCASGFGVCCVLQVVSYADFLMGLSSENKRGSNLS